MNRLILLALAASACGLYRSPAPPDYPQTPPPREVIVEQHVEQDPPAPTVVRTPAPTTTGCDLGCGTPFDAPMIDQYALRMANEKALYEAGDRCARERLNWQHEESYAPNHVLSRLQTRQMLDTCEKGNR